ncbi:MAG TPA: hypothetical protein VJ327_02080 [Patescibacteria group bacterium]|nr:hypothetical protein [Patescibacteria group bacterium]
MTEKDFNNLTGWVDYDRPLLKTQALTKTQEIMYFKKRINMVLLLPLNEMYTSLMTNKEYSSTVLCFGTCICCSIEALGKFHTGNLGEGHSGANFQQYVKDYMDPDYSQELNSNPYVNILWKSFRNGLAHGFTIKHGGFEHHNSYFKITNSYGVNQLEIDPTTFYNDFKQGVDKFIDKLDKVPSTDQIYINFHKAFEDIFIRGN